MTELAQLDWIAIVSRWAHILAAITAVGGTIFMRTALLPSVGVLPDEERKKLHNGVRSRWVKFVMAAILFLLVSGIYNIIMKEKQLKTVEDGAKSLYHMLFGVKFLLACVIFFLASVLSGRSPAFAKMRENARMWLTLNMILALIVVCISGVLRAIPLKEAAQPPKAAAVRYAPRFCASVSQAQPGCLHHKEPRSAA
ncbi:MAG TPA: hypothetical protein VMV10_12370 [Pirellulales bacterium]|nr:hypothetical protein [Pirellulales bacterium]